MKTNKIYVKPTMEVFEIESQNIIAASGKAPLIKDETFINNLAEQDTKNGNYKSIAAGGCTDFPSNVTGNNKERLWNEIYTYYGLPCTNQSSHIFTICKRTDGKYEIYK